MKSPTRIRPTFPKEWRVPDIPSKWITWEHASGKLEREETYWVATTREDGRPHSVPVSGIWLDSAFYFETEPGAVKTRNLQHNPNIVVHVQDGDDTVIVEGSAAIERRPALLTKLRKQYQSKYDYSPTWSGPGAQFVFRVEPKVILAWKSPRIHRTMVRFVF